MKEKPQTPSQRVANPVWLRGQIGALLSDCDANIEEATRLASQVSDDKRAVCLSRVESYRRWKRQLERILRGKTLAEDLEGAAAQEGPMTTWCPKCAAEIAHDRAEDPRCRRCGVLVDKIYRCHCGRPEELRATDDVPQYCHYCGRCAAALAAEVREHLVPVVARSTPTTGPWRPA